MKKLLAIFICLLFLPVQAAESPKNGYIAKVSAAQLYAVESDSAPVFITIDDLETAEMYLEMGLIEYFEINGTVHLFGDMGWIHSSVNLPAAHEANLSGKGVLVGVLDSGIYPHTDFGNNLVAGYNVLDNNADTSDTYGHGTWVAGTIAAAANGTGVSGVAPAASIMPIKCFEGRNTTIKAILDAIRYGTENGCKILNMSFGFDAASVGEKNITAVGEMISYAIENGVILVAAVGNAVDGANPTVLNYPAAYPGVIGVGAITEERQKAYFSHYNASVDIVAPGMDIRTTHIDGNYTAVNGTSLAAPIVSGILALGIEHAPTLAPTILTEVLKETATDLGDKGRDDFYGNGLANVSAFIEALSIAVDYPHLVSTPSGIAIYQSAPGSARVIFAHYISENELSSILHTELLTLDAGYTGFDATVPENTRVFLFDNMRPLGKPLQY